MMQAHLFKGVLAVFLALAVGVIGMVIWAIYLENPRMTYRNLPFPVTNERYIGPLVVSKTVAGEPVTTLVERCNNTDRQLTYITTHGFTPIDPPGDEIFMPDVRVSIEPGCHRGVSRINIVPANMPTGIYIAHGVAVLDATVGKRFVPGYTEKFEVIKKVTP